MATRQMVGTRKGAPAAKPGVAIMIGVGKPKGDAPDGDDSGSYSKDPTCPNCGCQFDPATGDIDKPGKPVKGGDGYGPELDAMDSAPPTPGKFGAAHDAAAGENALTDALASVLAGRR